MVNSNAHRPGVAQNMTLAEFDAAVLDGDSTNDDKLSIRVAEHKNGAYSEAYVCVFPEDVADMKRYLFPGVKTITNSNSY